MNPKAQQKTALALVLTIPLMILVFSFYNFLQFSPATEHILYTTEIATTQEYIEENIPPDVSFRIEDHTSECEYLGGGCLQFRVFVAGNHRILWIGEVNMEDEYGNKVHCDGTGNNPAARCYRLRLSEVSKLCTTVMTSTKEWIVCKSISETIH